MSKLPITFVNTRILILLLFLVGCKLNTNYQDPIPYRYVNFQVNLNDQEYIELKRDGGFVTLADKGVKGIILYRIASDRYVAIEQNCSFNALEECSKVVPDDSRLFLIDKCCSSQFNFEGYPIGGPATLKLKFYRTSLQANLLYVSN